MADRAAVLQLARLIGVDTHYTDALGETRQVSDDTLSALITGFGLPADPVSARRQLEDQYRELPLGLEAAQIVGAEDPQPELGLRLPVKCRKIVWTCRLEDGGECHGHAVLDGGARKGRLMMPLPAGLPLGYHRLEVEAGNISADINLIVAPDRCYLPAELGTGARNWGLSCQLYGLCSERNWGIGDFGDLATLARGAGRRGAAVVGINPLHALFAAEPQHVSPYSPSSRSQLDYLYIDVTAVPGFAEDEGAGELMRSEWFGATHWAARSAALIDYGAVAACKRPILEALFRRFQSRELGADGSAKSGLGAAFRVFQRGTAPSLSDFAVFEALHEHYGQDKQCF